MKIKIPSVIKSKGFLVGLSSGLVVFLIFAGLILFFQIRNRQGSYEPRVQSVTNDSVIQLSPSLTPSPSTEAKTKSSSKPVLGVSTVSPSTPTPAPQNQQPTNNTPQQIIVVVPTPTPTPAPVVAQDDSWKIEWCKNSIANYETSKQESINSAITSAQTECGKRGYSAPNYEGCESYIQARVNDVTGYWDSVILNFKLSNGCV